MPKQSHYEPMAPGNGISQPIGQGPQAQGLGLQQIGFEVTQMVSLHGFKQHIGSSLHGMSHGRSSLQLSFLNLFSLHFLCSLQSSSLLSDESEDEDLHLPPESEDEDLHLENYC